MKYKAFDKELKLFRNDVLIKPDGSIFIHLFQKPKGKKGESGLTVLLNAQNEDFEIEVIAESDPFIAQGKEH